MRTLIISGIQLLFLVVIAAFTTRFYALDWVVTQEWAIVTAVLVVLFFLFRDFFTRNLSKWLTLMVTVLVITLMADLGLRAAFSNKLYYRPHERFGQHWEKAPHLLARYTPNAEYEGTTFGDLAAMIGDMENKEERQVRFQSDELGLRNHPGQKDKANTVLIAGDSYGVGTGTDQDSTFWARLIRDYGYQLYNFSYTGSPFHAILNVAIDYPNVKVGENPTLIWLFYTGNDFSIGRQDQFDEAMEKVATNQATDLLEERWYKHLGMKLTTWMNRSPLRQLVRRIFAGAKGPPQVEVVDFEEHKLFYYQPYKTAATSSVKTLRESPNFESMRKVIAAGKAFADLNGIDLRIVVIPTKYEIYKLGWDNRDAPRRSGFSRVIEGIANENQVKFLDTRAIFAQAAWLARFRSKKLLWWRDDTHLNSEGNRVLAKILHEHVLSPPK